MKIVSIMLILVSTMLFACSNPVSPPFTGSLSKLMGDDQVGVVGDTLSVPLIVIVRNLIGNPVPYLWVEFNIVGGDASLTDSRALTDYNGRAGVALVLGPTPSLVQVLARVEKSDSYVMFTARGE